LGYIFVADSVVPHSMNLM